MFVQGRVYRRKDIHDEFGGQRVHGISTPKGKKFIFLFSGESGKEYGYSDGWSDNGIFFYTGEGQQGNMVFERGNEAIRDHQKEGKDLYLFEQARPGYMRYVGQMICTGFHLSEEDSKGVVRTVIHFELVPTSAFYDDSFLPFEEARKESLPELRLDALRSKALEDSTAFPTSFERATSCYHRSEGIKRYAQGRAKGTCEGCGKGAPFRTKSGNPYLEVHHLRSLSDSGPDHPSFGIAMCPNCHRRSHHAEDAEEFNRHLESIVWTKEADAVLRE